MTKYAEGLGSLSNRPAILETIHFKPLSWTEYNPEILVVANDASGTSVYVLANDGNRWAVSWSLRPLMRESIHGQDLETLKAACEADYQAYMRSLIL